MISVNFLPNNCHNLSICDPNYTKLFLLINHTNNIFGTFNGKDQWSNLDRILQRKYKP